MPFSTITDGPSISREAENPMTVTASFYTNDGPWEMMLHRTGQERSLACDLHQLKGRQ